MRREGGGPGPVLLIAAVDAEARVLADIGGTVVAGGVGRTNAASACTEAILRRGPFAAVLSAGVAGALPGGGLEIGQAVAASACVYAEEGIQGPAGFAGIEAMGLSLGPFAGNAVPVDRRLLELLAEAFPIGPIATVATCSGTDEAAREVVRRTGALAEAMEGAAVVHAALRLGVPAIELRTISNTTGERGRQIWDLERGLAALRTAAARAVEMIGRREA
jgi:futalosine hydrolase